MENLGNGVFGGPVVNHEDRAYQPILGDIIPGGPVVNHEDRAYQPILGDIIPGGPVVNHEDRAYQSILGDIIPGGPVVNHEDRAYQSILGDIIPGGPVVNHGDTAPQFSALSRLNNQETKIGGMTLIDAIRNEEKDIVRQHLDMGADVNANRNRYDIPLHEAVKTGNIDVVLLLLNRYADINIKNFREENVLFLIPEVKKDKKAMLSLLLCEDFRIEVNLFNKDSKNPIGNIINSRFGKASEKLSLIEMMALKNFHISNVDQEKLGGLFTSYRNERLATCFLGSGKSITDVQNKAKALGETSRDFPCILSRLNYDPEKIFSHTQMLMCGRPEAQRETPPLCCCNM